MGPFKNIIKAMNPFPKKMHLLPSTHSSADNVGGRRSRKAQRLPKRPRASGQERLRGEQTGTLVREDWVHILVPSFTACVALDKLDKINALRSCSCIKTKI